MSANKRSRSEVTPGFHLRTFLLMGALVATFGLVGCNTSSIHQDDRYNPPVYWGRHVVERGETLYSIAWRYGRDYRELGDANNIPPPYNLEAGQVLRLDQRGSVSSTSRSSTQAVPARQPSSKSPKPTRAKASPVPKPASAPSSTDRGSQTVAAINWRWPHVGTVIAAYSTSGMINKGIDIAGNPGDSVRAAASGNVVYAGDGLLGYGNLIIVNHNKHYLSAYAHNRKILVKEGEDVAAGQIIAELGSSGTSRPKLHFEIRKNGKPVDPMPYLPPR